MADWQIDNSAFNPTDTGVHTTGTIIPLVSDGLNITPTVTPDTTSVYSLFPTLNGYNSMSTGAQRGFTNVSGILSNLGQPVDLSRTQMGQFLSKHGYLPSNADAGTLNALQKEIQGVGKGLGQLNTFNKIGLGLQGLGTIAGIYQGYKQLKLANKQFEHAKMESERNYQAQKKMVNSKLEDRQARRVAEANVNGHQATSVADYMKQYGV